MPRLPRLPLGVVTPLARGVYQARKTWGRVTRPVTIGVRLAAFDEDAVLLVRHTYLSGWFLPGGGVDRGETLPQAAARELREEAGLHLHGEAEVLTAHTWFHAGRTDHVVLLKGQASGAPVTDGVEIAEAAWFRRDALPDPLSKITREQLAWLGWIG